MRFSLTLFVLAVLFVAVVVGCSPSPPTPTPLSPRTRTPQEASLLAAQEEGALKFYTSLNDDEVRPLLLRFNQKYPFLKVDYYRASSFDVLQKVLNEAIGGLPLPDVLELDGVDMVHLYNEKLLAAYTSPEATILPDGAKHPWGYYTTCYINALVIAYNTNLVRPEDAPKGWNDLLNPRWAGKMGIEPEDWALIPFSSRVWGDTAANNFWTKLAEQKPKLIKGHSEVADAVAKGDVALSPTTLAHRDEELKTLGQPIEWVKTDPVYAYLNAVAITAKASHPNAARVFVDWLLSTEGQTTVSGVGLIPIRPGIKANPASMTEGVKFYYGDPLLIRDVNIVRTQYYSLFGVR